MRAYSQDLRERVVKGLLEGKTQAWVAATYRVSLSSVQRWIALYRQSGEVKPRVQKRMVGLIGEQEYGALRALVERMSEAQLPVYCAAWERETGVVVSTKTMSRMLVRLGLRRKKDHRRVGAG